LETKCLQIITSKLAITSAIKGRARAIRLDIVIVTVLLERSHTVSTVVLFGYFLQYII